MARQQGEINQRSTFKMAEQQLLLTAQVAFLRQGDSQVAVPPTEVVGQEGREGKRTIVPEPLLRMSEDENQ